MSQSERHAYGWGLPGLRPGAQAGVVAFVLCIGLARPLVGEPVQCPDPLFSVAAEDAELADGLCSMASDIRDTLGSCGLIQQRSLSIEVVEDVGHPLGNCLAYFDCDYDLIRLTDPATYETRLRPEDPYAHLPEEVLLRALLTHELAHALATQSAGERQIDIVDQEYIAAAMELGQLDPEARDVILKAAPVDLPPKEGMINTVIYAFAPRKFAVNAWQHFEAQDDGCAVVRQIIAGERSFSMGLRPEMQ